MAEKRCFYQDLTEIAESRIKELIRHAEEMEAHEQGLPNAGKYFRDCAFTIYLAWRDVTDGWHGDDDLERLETLTNGASWVN
jgi:hypothetical protein